MISEAVGIGSQKPSLQPQKDGESESAILQVGRIKRKRADSRPRTESYSAGRLFRQWKMEKAHGRRPRGPFGIGQLPRQPLSVTSSVGEVVPRKEAV